MRLANMLVFLLILPSLTGCVVATVASAAVTVVAVGVKTTAKVAGAVVDAAIPDDEDVEEEDQ